MNSHALQVVDSSTKQNNPAEITSSRTHDFPKPHENDVLLGRGTPTNVRRGNVQFRFLIKCYKEDYISRKDHYGKYLVTMEVHQRIKNLLPPGRFMRHDSNINKWIEIDDKEARNKISQALRDHAPGKKKGYGKTKSCKLKDVKLNRNKKIIHKTKVDVPHHRYSQMQHTPQNKNCTKFMDNVEHCQSEVDVDLSEADINFNLSETDMDLSEVGLDLNRLINSIDIKKIHEEFSCA